MNQVVLIGRLARDPELKFIPGSGQAVCNFTIALEKSLSREKKEEFKTQGKPTADFVRVVVWGKQAENASQYLVKGRLVAIEGSIQTSTHKDAEGKTHYNTEVLASRIEYLEWGEKSNKQSTSEFANDDLSFGSGSFEDFQQIDSDEDVPF